MQGRWSVEAGGAAIHFPTDSRDAGEAITIKLFQPQACVQYQSIDAAIEIAAASQEVLQRVESILPPGGEGIVAAAVLQEQKVAIRLQYPANIAKRLPRIRNGAEGEGADCVVEAGIVIGQSFSTDMPDVNGKRCLCHPHGDSIRQERSGIDGVQSGDGPRVVRQVQSGSEPDFQYESMYRSQQEPAFGLEPFAPEHPIHESRKDVGGVHRRWQRSVRSCAVDLRRPVVPAFEQDSIPGSREEGLFAVDSVPVCPVPSLSLRAACARVVRSFIQKD